ncbi:MAG: diguanylate cyclase [Candidatus Omnitrophica bacterium]|nr:diguanylate cyclase [Candidatus Omnitrophota bacterium]
MDNLKIKLLLIEDNEEYAAILKQRLSQENKPSFEVECAHTLGTSLEKIRTIKDINVVLLDLSLPDSQSEATFEKIYAEAAHVPIIILTGSHDEAFARETLRKGAQDYLFKHELDLKVLGRVMRHAIERHRIKRELDSANARLENLALLDPLTELLNRRGLQAALSRELQWAHREGTSFLVLLIDLDNFKTINDTLGHAVGDIVLKEVARKLGTVLRTTDYVARIGGDEFMILLPETRWAEGLKVAERVRLTISQDSISMGSSGPVMVTASLGLATISPRTSSIDELLVETHMALHRSKREGKNKVSYGHENGWLAGGNDRVVSDVLEALRRNDKFHVFSQPIIRLSDDSKIGYELFSHLSINGVEMPPEDFFRLCLENNILTLVDHRCFQICTAAAKTFPSGVCRHLNLFPSTLINIPVQHLIDVLPAGSPKGSYCVEISEQQIIGDPSYLTKAVGALKEANVSVAIDDVGFGRSCLESLILLEPDIVKIDKKCVMGFSRDDSRARSLKRILKVTASLGAKVIAEGIETKADLDLLKEFGVEYGQGYFWGKPVEIPFPRDFAVAPETLPENLRKLTKTFKTYR